MSSPLCFRPVRVQWLPAFFKKYVICISTLTPRERRDESHNYKNLLLYTFQSTRRPREARLFGGCIAAVPVR